MASRRRLCLKGGMAGTFIGGIPIVFVSFPGIRGKQRWVAAVAPEEVLPAVRERIPPDATAELSDQHLSREQAAKLKLKIGDVRCLDYAL